MSTATIEIETVCGVTCPACGETGTITSEETIQERYEMVGFDKDANPVYGPAPTDSHTSMQILHCERCHTDVTMNDLKAVSLAEGLPRNTRYVLSNIDTRRGSTPHEIAHLAGLTEPTVRNHLFTLAEMGLLTGDLADGPWSLTDLGRAAADRLR